MLKPSPSEKTPLVSSGHLQAVDVGSNIVTQQFLTCICTSHHNTFNEIKPKTRKVKIKNISRISRNKKRNMFYI